MPRGTVVAAVTGLVLLGSVSPVPAAARAETAIEWTHCKEAPAGHPAQCGRVNVPVDWDHPASERMSVRVAKLPAAQPEKRIGTLMFNPGGPGGPAAGIVALPQAIKLYFPKEIRDRFDIVGVDPRGVGGSHPVRCGKASHDPSVSRFPANAEDARKLLANNREFAQSCRQHSGHLMANLGTESVARDFDAVRRQLGEQKISFLGLSYGTMLAQSYAELFPEHIRALVLDGVVDRSLSWQRMVRDNAVAAQDSVNRFSAWCAGNPDCALGNVKASIERVLGMADAGKLVANKNKATSEEVAVAINGGLNLGNAKSQLAKALRTAEDTSDATQLISMGSFSRPGSYTPYRAIVCQDVPVRNPAALAAEARRVRALGPSLRGASEFWDIASGCAGWPERTTWRPHLWRVPEGFRALLISGAHDIATPRPWAEAVHRQLPDSELVRWPGDGHTAWLNNQPARQAGVDYLLKVPADQ